MTARKAASPAALSGQLLWIGFDGTQWSRAIERLLRDGAPRAGTVLAGLYAAPPLRAGVVPVGKHFPGLGGAGGDTHQILPLVTRTRTRLLREDLLPYRRLRATLPMVMIGHAFYPTLQGKIEQPASLASGIVTTLLRRQVGYRGLVITDDLEMGAVDQSLDGGAQAMAALRAGA